MKCIRIETCEGYNLGEGKRKRHTPLIKVVFAGIFFFFLQRSWTFFPGGWMNAIKWKHKKQNVSPRWRWCPITIECPEHNFRTLGQWLRRKGGIRVICSGCGWLFFSASCHQRMILLTEASYFNEKIVKFETETEHLPLVSFWVNLKHAIDLLPCQEIIILMYFYSRNGWRFSLSWDTDWGGKGGLSDDLQQKELSALKVSYRFHIWNWHVCRNFV